MSFYSNRTLRVVESASNAAGQRARELLAEGRSIINLTLGEPDFETPENIKEAAIKAIRDGKTRYTNVDGTPELKAAVAAKFLRENKLHYKANEVIVSSGAKQVVYNALMATINRGDEVIIPAPHWVSYPEIVRFAGGTPVVVACDVNDDFKLSPARLAETITPRTKWLILNSPSNPTGAAYTLDELRALGKVLLDHPDVWVLTDDIYEHLIYADVGFATILNAVPELEARTLTVNGVSKAYAMTGWRIGYAGGPAPLIRQIAKIQSQSTSNPSSIGQAAAVEALNGTQECVEIYRRAFHDRRDLIVAALNRIPGLPCTMPDGAFYVFPSCRAFLGMETKAGKVIESDLDFSAHLLERGVATVAGTPYGLTGYCRISFAASDEALREGARRIEAACAELICRSTREKRAVGRAQLPGRSASIIADSQ